MKVASNTFSCSGLTLDRFLRSLGSSAESSFSSGRLFADGAVHGDEGVFEDGEVEDVADADETASPLRDCGDVDPSLDPAKTQK